MADLNVNVSVTVTTETPPAGVAGFTVPVFFGVIPGFGLDVLRFYESIDDVDQDADLSVAVRKALEAGFSQNPNCKKIGAAKVESTGRMIVVFSTAGINSDAGAEYRIYIDDLVAEYVSPGGEDRDDVAAGLRAAATAAFAGLNVTVDGLTNNIEISADTVDDTFWYAYENSIPKGNVRIDNFTVDFGTITSDWETALDNALEADDSWYGIGLQDNGEATINACAAWAEPRKKFMIPQSSDDEVRDATAGNVAEDLQGNGYNQTGLAWYSKNWLFEAFAWMCKTFAADPDERVTIWAYKTLNGITSDKDALNTTQKNNILNQNANLYLPFKSTPVTAQGRVASGLPMDLVVTLNWVEARVQENVVSALISYSNRNERIPFTDAGIAVMKSLVLDVLKRGERIGHFVEESSTVSAPTLAEVAPVDRSNRLLRIEFQTTAAGAIEKATINGYVSVSI